jgi:hypothetical protein
MKSVDNILCSLLQQHLACRQIRESEEEFNSWHFSSSRAMQFESDKQRVFVLLLSPNRHRAHDNSVQVASMSQHQCSLGPHVEFSLHRSFINRVRAGAGEMRESVSLLPLTMTGVGINEINI